MDSLHEASTVLVTKEAKHTTGQKNNNTISHMNQPSQRFMKKMRHHNHGRLTLGRHSLATLN